jgi:AraC-like DNA-binding protein
MDQRAVHPNLPAFAIVPDEAIRVGPVMHIPAIVAAGGRDVAPILAALGLPGRLFDDPDTTVPFRLLGELVARCAAALDDPDFGLRVGAAGGIESLGAAGVLLQHSPDVGTALRNFVLRLAMHDRGGVLLLDTAGSTAKLGYAIYLPDVPATAHILAGAMAIGCNLLRALCGPEFRLREVSFAFRRPADVRPYKRVFMAPLRFDADESALRFSAHFLGRPVAGADPALYRLIESEVRALETRARSTLHERLVPLLRALVATGGATIDRAATLLAVHTRTLNRRLRERGTTFREVMEEVRFAMARQMMTDTDMPLAAIAAALDYADASVFSRAFRRWSGHSPADWRQHGRTAARKRR